MNTPITGSPEAYQHTLLGQIDRRTLQLRYSRHIAAVLGIAVLIIPAVQSVHYIQKVDKSEFREGGERRKTAIGRWMPTAELLTGEDTSTDPYGFGHWFPLPPMILLTLTPFTKMSYVAVAVVWAILKIVGICISVVWLIRSARSGTFDMPLGVLLMMTFFAFRPIIADLQHGNVNIFMFIWLALCWAMYVHKHDVWAGVFLSLAIVTKITPALALVYFLYKRAWKLCAVTGVGLILWFIVVPGLFLGFGRNFELLESWSKMLIGPYAIGGWVAAETANQSFYGTLVRLMDLSNAVPIEHTSLEEVSTAGIFMIRPHSALVRLVRPIISLVFVGSLAWLCRTKTGNRRDLRLFLEFSLVLLAMLLLSERTWKHHATTLVIVYLGVWTVLTCVHWSDRFRAIFVTGLVIQWMLLVGTSSGLLGDGVAEIMLNGGAFCWGLLLCFVQTAVLLRLAGRPVPGVSAPEGDLAPRTA